jgi:hypothetical protein
MASAARSAIRLEAAEADAIVAAARAAFGADVVVRLFGSRCHPARRGGDIDLHFTVSPGAATEDAVDAFEAQLFRTLDAQKIDKIFTERGQPPCTFARIALRDGILL